MFNYTVSLTTALDGGRWSAPRPGRFTPGKPPVPIVQEAGWAPGPVSTGAEKLAPPHRDSIPGPFSQQRVAIPTELYRPTTYDYNDDTGNNLGQPNSAKRFKGKLGSHTIGWLSELPFVLCRCGESCNVRTHCLKCIILMSWKTFGTFGIPNLTLRDTGTYLFNPLALEMDI